jgi:serine/threonine protein phosphatase 1
MRTLVIGDIHGAYVHCTKLWKEPRSPRRYSDFSGRLRRWLESPQVLDYLIELNTTNNCVFIRGNHDELLLHWLETAKTILCGTSTEVNLLMKSQFRYKTITC